eukprot:COSAG02_NODE_3062_length_7447_cov_14.342678_8_plen_221_part_00
MPRWEGDHTHAVALVPPSHIECLPPFSGQFRLPTASPVVVGPPLLFTQGDDNRSTTQTTSADWPCRVNSKYASIRGQFPHSAVKTMIMFSIIFFFVSAAVTLPTPCQQPIICSHHTTVRSVRRFLIRWPTIKIFRPHLVHRSEHPGEICAFSVFNVRPIYRNVVFGDLRRGAAEWSGTESANIMFTWRSSLIKREMFALTALPGTPGLKAPHHARSPRIL